MRLVILTTLLLVGFTHAETIEVYREDRVETPKHVRSNLTGKPTYWIATGKLVGKLDLGEATLGKIVADYREASWKDEPFYGPVEQFVFVDSKGRFYVAHLEYLKDSELLGEGRRVAINELKKVQGRKGMFTGSPYSGSSVFHEGILKKLRALVAK
ncbi:hypothetical protein HNR46_003111 [Haloferula luteola]|uniref:Uncharacterized protein n=1 Tax=Haloferula luteola TaxID=595692 RepID=A0A840V5F7_9BACT|nr:hypothetical protein [Haloferula luteola]MBB5352863.1 hypothetical protein [Haloferula luteola]